MPKRTKKPPPNNLPATMLDLEARAFAWIWLNKMRITPLFDSPYGRLDPAASHWYLRDVGKQFVESNPLNAARMVEAAVHGNREADEVLQEVMDEKVNRGEPLGAVLGAYDIRARHPEIHHNPGKSKATYMVQDIFIAGLVAQLVEMFPPLKPTRSQVGRKLQSSACSIVAEVLAWIGMHRGDERTIQAIWRRYGSSMARRP